MMFDYRLTAQNLFDARGRPVTVFTVEHDARLFYSQVWPMSEPCEEDPIGPGEFVRFEVTGKNKWAETVMIVQRGCEAAIGPAGELIQVQRSQPERADARHWIRRASDSIWRKARERGEPVGVEELRVYLREFPWLPRQSS